jgi:hypothetical protein
MLSEGFYLEELSVLEIFALIVLLVLCAAAIWLVVLIGNIPGNMARAANHPQAEAISLLAWVGFLTLGIGWFVALVWARVVPPDSDSVLESRVRELEQKMAQLEGQR